MFTVINARYVSTHSRLKAAGQRKWIPNQRGRVSTHSRLKAAGKVVAKREVKLTVSTHSRLKAAGRLVFSFRLLV